jgi:hypothetical protein
MSGRSCPAGNDISSLLAENHHHNQLIPLVLKHSDMKPKDF